MMYKFKRQYVRLVIGLCLLLILNEFSFSLIVGNYLQRGFQEPSNLSATNTESATIEALIINGAGHFLAGNAKFLTLLNRVEVSTNTTASDYSEWKTILSNAIAEMNKAKETYTYLVEKANATPYEQSMIELLMDYDYDSFREERQLSGNAIDRLEKLFKNGDVRGTFTALLFDTEKLISMLNSVALYLEAEKFPAITDLWRINQQFSETMLFGQYAAEVMYSISN